MPGSLRRPAAPVKPVGRLWTRSASRGIPRPEGYVRTIPLNVSQRGVPLNYDPEDLEADRAALGKTTPTSGTVAILAHAADKGLVADKHQAFSALKTAGFRASEVVFRLAGGYEKPTT